MTLSDFRKARGLTLDEAVREIGLRSKGHLSEIESKAETPSLRLALQIETWSDGAVPAQELLGREDAALLANHRRLAAGQATPA